MVISNLGSPFTVSKLWEAMKLLSLFFSFSFIIIIIIIIF
jgi:hypothetical protein